MDVLAAVPLLHRLTEGLARRIAELARMLQHATRMHALSEHQPAVALRRRREAE